MRKFLFTGIAAVAAVCFAGATRADDQKMSDSKFVKEANQINLEEIQVGKIAQQHAASAAIKRFGEHLARDHTRMNEELMAIARKKAITLPKTLDSETQEKVDRLSKLTGAEFDRAFSKAMIAGHEKAIEKFEMAAKNSQDPDVKAWSDKRVATLR